MKKFIGILLALCCFTICFAEENNKKLVLKGEKNGIEIKINFSNYLYDKNTYKSYDDLSNEDQLQLMFKPLLLSIKNGTTKSIETSRAYDVLSIVVAGKQFDITMTSITGDYPKLIRKGVTFDCSLPTGLSYETLFLSAANQEIKNKYTLIGVLCMLINYYYDGIMDYEKVKNNLTGYFSITWLGEEIELTPVVE